MMKKIEKLEKGLFNRYVTLGGGGGFNNVRYVTLTKKSGTLKIKVKYLFDIVLLVQAIYKVRVHMI